MYYHKLLLSPLTKVDSITIKANYKTVSLNISQNPIIA